MLMNNWQIGKMKVFKISIRNLPKIIKIPLKMTKQIQLKLVNFPWTKSMKRKTWLTNSPKSKEVKWSYKNDSRCLVAKIEQHMLHFSKVRLSWELWGNFSCERNRENYFSDFEKKKNYNLNYFFDFLYFYLSWHATCLLHLWFSLFVHALPVNFALNKYFVSSFSLD